MPQERHGMSREEAGRKGGEANKGTTHESHGQGRVVDPERDRRTKEGQEKSDRKR